MELYTLGRLALPVVIAIIGVAGVVTLFSGFGTLLRLLSSAQRAAAPEKAATRNPGLDHHATAAGPQPSHAGTRLSTSFRRGMGAPESSLLMFGMVFINCSQIYELAPTHREARSVQVAQRISRIFSCSVPARTPSGQYERLACHQIWCCHTGLDYSQKAIQGWQSPPI